MTAGNERIGDCEFYIHKAINKGVSLTLISDRLDYIENHPDLINDYSVLEQYILTGIIINTPT